MKMLDAWLKGKFYSKCKSAIKLTDTRIELIRRKRNAMQKYLKDDIAELLKNDLDVNAYGRAEGLLVELNRSSCYDLMEQYCQQILSNLSAMTKQRECPEDCKEAVSTLMFAAARFADLPELRSLRTIFAERYGRFIEYYVSKEFCQKLKPERPSNEMKLQLMQDIASEFGIEWNSKALEHKLYGPPAIEQDSSMNGNDQTHALQRKIDENPREDLSSRRSNKAMDDDEYNPSNRNQEKESDVKVPFSYKLILPPYTRGEKMKGASDAASAAGFVGESRVEEARPKPKSVRTTRKLAPADDRSNSRTERWGTKVSSTDDDSDQQDVEEKLDTLLAHYSRKKPDKEPKELPEQDEEASCSKIPRRRSIDVPPSRASSLPAETHKSSPTNKSPKGHFRANSYHAETSNPKGHVHPKLPDYDDLIARLAAARADMK